MVFLVDSSSICCVFNKISSPNPAMSRWWVDACQSALCCVQVSDREMKPLEDALVVYAEEGRMYTYDIAGKPVNRRFTQRFPNGAIPLCENKVSPVSQECSISDIPFPIKFLSVQF